MTNPRSWLVWCGLLLAPRIGNWFQIFASSVSASTTFPTQEVLISSAPSTTRRVRLPDSLPTFDAAQPNHGNTKQQLLPPPQDSQTVTRTLVRIDSKFTCTAPKGQQGVVTQSTNTWQKIKTGDQEGSLVAIGYGYAGATCRMLMHFFAYNDDSPFFDGSALDAGLRLSCVWPGLERIVLRYDDLVSLYHLVVVVV